MTFHPRKAKTRRLVAVLPDIVRRLVSEPGATLITLSAEYRCGRTTLKGYVHKAMTREQKRAWVHKVRCESMAKPVGKRPARAPLGTVSTRGGHKWIKVSGDRHATRSKNGWKQLARYVWEAANGPIPKGHVIYYMDRNPLNCDLRNLDVMTSTEKLQRTVFSVPEVERRRVENYRKARRKIGQLQKIIKGEKKRRMAAPVEYQPRPEAPRDRARANVTAFLASLATA